VASPAKFSLYSLQSRREIYICTDTAIHGRIHTQQWKCWPRRQCTNSKRWQGHHTYRWVESHSPWAVKVRPSEKQTEQQSLHVTDRFSSLCYIKLPLISLADVTDAVIGRLSILLDSDVVVGRRDSDTTFLLLEVYKRGASESLVKKRIGDWREGRGLRISTSPVISARRINLHKALLKAVMVVSNRSPPGPQRGNPCRTFCINNSTKDKVTEI
jgi:hypothetical protein